LVSIVVSAVSLVLAALGIDWSRVGQVFEQADLRYLALATIALLGFVVARSVRWRILLGDRVGLRTVFAVTNIGYLVSNVFPFRLGDPTRAVIVALGRTVPLSTALSTVVVERTLDMFVVVVLLGATLPFVSDAGWTRVAGLVGGGASIVALIIFFVLARWPQLGQRVVRHVTAHTPSLNKDRWHRAIDGALEGFAALGSPSRLITTAAWSLVAWACSVGFYRAVLQSFVDSPTWLQAAFLTCAISFAVALPSSPGALGVFQTVARYMLQVPFGIRGEQAVSVAFGAHALMYVMMCLLGILGLAQLNLSFASLRRAVGSAVSRVDDPSSIALVSEGVSTVSGEE